MCEGFSKKHLEELKAERRNSRFRDDELDEEPVSQAYLEHLRLLAQEKEAERLNALENAKQDFRKNLEGMKKEWQMKQ